MKDKIDRKTEEALLNALARVHEDREKYERKREERLWKEITVPCTLSGVLSRLTKNELDCIRQNLNLTGLSALKKNDLVGELERLLPENVNLVFALFDDERYRLARRICENGGFVLDKGLPIDKAEYFQQLGVIFPGRRNGRKALFMPMELVQVFKEVDNPEYRKLVRENTKWVRLTHGLLYYYGFLTYNQLQSMVGSLVGEKLNFLRYMELLLDAVIYHSQIRYDGIGYCDIRVFDAQKIQDEHNARPEVKYRTFNAEQLIKAGAPDYIDWTPSLRMFTDFLRDHYEISKEEVNEIADQCLYIINSEGKPGAILEYLQSLLEFPSFEFVQELTGLMMPLFNNISMWILKGHTPNELFKDEKKHLKPLSKAPVEKDGLFSNVIDIQTRKLVGRNDPCPCGSGKKFKKCCGK